MTSSGLSTARARPAAMASAPAWRAVLAPPAVALVTLLAAIVATDAADVAFRDPDNVAAGYVLIMLFAVAALVGVDVWIRAARGTHTWRPSRQAMLQVRRERWTRHRTAAMACALISFYVTYLAYRNLKGVIPMLRPGDLFDSQMASLDRAMFAGHDPATLLHSMLGAGFTAHVLSVFYVAFIVFLPLSLAVALVFARDLPTTLFYATALSVNWVLGAASYFAWPALGPVYADAGLFANLPHTEVTRLQQLLLDDRTGWLRDPATATPQAIAAFASLHIAMSFTAVLAAHLLGLGRRLKIALWAWLGITTVATIYLGWHYVIDDIAGLAIGAAALLIARALTGFDWRTARRREGTT
jgi:hypothetical protein